MRTLVLGLGNPILSDDGVGIYVARELVGRLDHRDVTVMEASAAGLSLLDLLVGYDKAIIIDAAQTGAGKPGQIHRLDAHTFRVARRAVSPHDIDLPEALELGKSLGLPLPREIVIFAIEAEDVSTFKEECTPEVRQAIPICVEEVIRELDGDYNA